LTEILDNFISENSIFSTSTASPNRIIIAVRSGFFNSDG
jgi:hypothetical protein